MADKTTGFMRRPLKAPAIPTLANDNLHEVVAAVVRWIQTREGRLGDGLDRAVTVRELGDLDLINIRTLRPTGAGSPGSGLVPGGVDDITPPTPTNLRAGGALQSIILQWDAQPFAAFSHFEVWRGPTNALGNAALIAITTATVAADYPPSAATFYYWVRAVSIFNRFSQYDTLNGTPASLAPNPAVLLAALSNQITESELYQTLRERIDLVDGAPTLTNSVSGRIKIETDARIQAISDEIAARIQGDTNTLAGAQTYTANFAYSKAGTDAAIAATANQLRTEFVAAGNGPSDGAAILASANAYTESWAYSRSQADSAIAATATTLRSEFTTADTSVLTQAQGYVQNYAYTKSTIDTTIAQTMATLRAETSSAAAGTLASAQTYTQSFAYSAGAGTALAGQVSSLAASVSDLDSEVGTISGALQTEQQASANDRGHVSTLYTVRTTVSADGRTVAGGFGLAGQAGPGVGPTIDFGVAANKFYVAAPNDGSGIPAILPFVVQTTPVTINGVTIGPGVYMDAAYITNLTALVARLGTAWVDNAMIANLSAAKLTAGDGTVGGVLKSTNYVAGSAGWRLSPTGQLEANNAVVRGTVYATDGIFAGLLQAARGTLGQVSIPDGGFLAVGATGFNSGTGFYVGFANGAPVFSIGAEGGQGMWWDGVALRFRRIFLPQFTAFLPANGLTVSVGAGAQYYGELSVTLFADIGDTTGYFTRNWAVVPRSNVGRVWLEEGPNDQTIRVYGDASGAVTSATVLCFVTSLDGRTTVARALVRGTHAAAPAPPPPPPPPPDPNPGGA